jgi:hypothetical protein
MRGESVLINDYYRLLHQTMEKEAVIQEKEKAIHELYKDLAQKEKIINTLQKVSIFHQFKKFIKGRK